MGKKIRASDLGKLDYCERKIHLDAVRGDRTPSEIRGLREAGTAAHSRFERERGTDKRCFIATCVYGTEAPQTRTLRSYRDSTLLPTWWGRLLVQAYYLVSPRIVLILERTPGAARLVRSLLDRVTRRIAPG